MLDRTTHYCIIGAGSSGLTAAKNLQQVELLFDVLEQANDLGGIWNYGQPQARVYRSTHLISSKPLTEYTDFPMPEAYPDYPDHKQVLAYFRLYAEHFDLFRHIQFNTLVTQVVPVEGETYWDVTVRLANGGEETRRYQGIIIANGHLSNSKYPTYPGNFTGQVLHSHGYRTPEVLEGKRVLIIGAGNSGCDIAVEAASHASRTLHSTRRGYYYMPKYLYGQPADQVNERMLRLNLPLGLRRWLATITYSIFVGDLTRFGIPKPDHRLFETHPIVNSQMPYFVGHGDIVPKPDVREFRGGEVVFVDGTVEPVDLVMYATGYTMNFPFIDTCYLHWQKDHPGFFLNVFHPEYDNLFIAGLIQPDSGQWGLVDRQCQLIAGFIVSQQRAPQKARQFHALKSVGQESYSGGICYKESSRHTVEIAHYPYRRRLDRLIREFVV